MVGLMPAPARADVSLRLSPEVLVQADQVTVADLGPIEGDHALAERLGRITLGPAPMPGSSYRFNAGFFQARLRQYQIDPAHVHLIAPDRVTIVRAFQVLAGQALLDVATRQALARLDTLDPPGGPYALSPVNRPGDQRVPTGHVEIEARVQDGSPPYIVMPVAVTIRVDGRDFQTLPLAFRVSRQQSVVVAARFLDPRASLGAVDFRIERRAATEVPPGALAAVAGPEDMEVVRAIGPGEVVTDRLLRPRIVVRRNEMVTLIVEGQGFRITTRGQVTEEGRRGDTVRVVNPASKRELVGRVEGPGVVRVTP
jgi:flagella basal body P-ring formation protein FlgA